MQIRRSGLAAVCLLLVGTVLAISPGIASASARSNVAGSRPSWATASNRVSAAKSSDLLQFRVYLHGRDDAGEEALAQQLTNPRSPLYQHWLTPAQETARFGATPSTLSSVSKWLKSSGFAINEVAANKLYIQATGTVAQAQRAFAVSLGQYRIRGWTLRAPDRDLSLPNAIRPLVVGVVGVDQSEDLFTPNTVNPDDTVGATPNASVNPNSVPPPPAGFRNAPPCSSYFGEKHDTTDPAYGGGFPNPLPYAPCGYTPPQLRSAYGMDAAVKAGITGKGVTVAIVDAYASPNLYDDAAQYAKNNDPTHPLGIHQYSSLIFAPNDRLATPAKCDASGWYGEQNLDVEAVHTMAPEANILYVGGSSCSDKALDRAVNTVVAKGLAQIVTNSYGSLGEDLPQTLLDAFEKIAIKAANQGVGLYFSSGDFGSEKFVLGSPQPDFSASSPWVTAVGGTSTGIGSDGKLVEQTGWETGKSSLSGGSYSPPAPGGFQYGSGGGTSHQFDEPGYQKGVVPDHLARLDRPSGRGRVVPDVAMNADPNTGMLIGITQTFPDGVYYDQYRIGGTSLASPLFAGVMALADQAAGKAHGFLNPTLYGSLAGTSALTDVLHVNDAVVRVDFIDGIDGSAGTVTSVRSFDFKPEVIDTEPGYDRTTGLGTPNGMTFLNALK